MLVARRDPPFHGDARDIASINIEANPGSKQPRVVRFVTVIQMIGSLLAVPVGIGSAYTFYRALGFSETIRVPGYYRGRESALRMIRMLRVARLPQR